MIMSDNPSGHVRICVRTVLCCIGCTRVVVSGSYRTSCQDLCQDCVLYRLYSILELCQGRISEMSGFVSGLYYGGGSCVRILTIESDCVRLLVPAGCDRECHIMSGCCVRMHDDTTYQVVSGYLRLCQSVYINKEKKR